MDQIAPSLTFALVAQPGYGPPATLAFRAGRLLGQLAWDGYAPEYRGKLSFGQSLFDGKRVIAASGAYGEAEAWKILPPDPELVRAWNGGAR